jgi:hypothetical protein
MANPGVDVSLQLLRAARPGTWTVQRVARLLQVRAETRQIVVFAFGIRVFTAAAAVLANILFPLAQRQQFTVFDHPDVLWDTFARYDSGWFYGIARHGYQYVEGGRNNLAFFPLYPLLMRHVGRLFGNARSDYYLGGIIVSWIAFIGAMLLLYHVARLDLSRRAAQRAVWYTAMFPFAFFYGVVYAESLFLFLLLASVYGFRTRRWTLAGVAGALACCSRVSGVFALPALALLAWRSVEDRSDRLKAAGAFALATSGIVGYSIYVYSLSGSPFEWAASITRWDYMPGRAPMTPIFGMLGQFLPDPIGYLTQDPMGPYDVLNGITATVCLAAIPFVWRQFGAAYGVLMLVSLWVPLSSGSFEGLGRYSAVLFPMCLWLATFRSPQVQGWTFALFGMAYMLCLALFTNLHPIF